MANIPDRSQEVHVNQLKIQMHPKSKAFARQAGELLLAISKKIGVQIPNAGHCQPMP